MSNEKDTKDAKVDELDIEIINALIESKSNKLRNVAKKINKSMQTVHNRLEKLKKKGVIKGFLPIVDEDSLGYKITVILLINVKRPFMKNIVDSLKSKSNCTTLFEVSGPYNVLAIFKMKSIKELSEIVEEVSKKDYVLDIETSVTFNKFKEELLPWPLKP